MSEMLQYMMDSFGRSEKADTLRCLYFGCMKAQNDGQIQRAQEICGKLQDFVEEECTSHPEQSRFAESLLAWCQKTLMQLHSHPAAKQHMQGLLAQAFSKESGLEGFQFSQNKSSLPSKGKAATSSTGCALLEELLSIDLEQKMKVTSYVNLGPDKSIERTGGQGSQAEQQTKQAQGNFQADGQAKVCLGDSDVATRWKRKRLVVPSPPNAFYDSSPEELEFSPKPKLRTGKDAAKAKTQGEAAVGKGLAGFQTARSALNAERRMNGKAESTNDDFSAGRAVQDGQGHGEGWRPQVASGLRRGATQNGGKGGFIPPFAKKAMQDAKEPQESVLSAKTLELLGVGGDLPEGLQKLDPNILELVCNEILDTRAAVSWEDIAGQEDAKSLVQELVVWPMLNPHLFTGLLLFGPPGTGKTLIGRAIASNIKATFFNISASSLTSKWIGEGEKMVRALFAVAMTLQPAVIFMDEIDSVLSARKAEGEHEASRRLKTELLVQMEGVNPSGTESRILLVGATNRPEELDEAARRRMPKQLYIPLPCEAARESMLRRQLGPGCGVRADLPDTDIAKVVAKTSGYSGSDMRNLIQEASQGPVRDAVKHHGAGIAGLSEADLRAVVLKDFQIAARAQRASVEPSEITRYEEYNTRHGARYAKQLNDSLAPEDEEEDW